MRQFIANDDINQWDNLLLVPKEYLNFSLFFKDKLWLKKVLYKQIFSICWAHGVKFQCPPPTQHHTLRPYLKVNGKVQFHHKVSIEFVFFLFFLFSTLFPRYHCLTVGFFWQHQSHFKKVFITSDRLEQINNWHINCLLLI